jgi:hypothetical protein
MTFQRQVTVRINDVYNLVTNKKFSRFDGSATVFLFILKHVPREFVTRNHDMWMPNTFLTNFSPDSLNFTKRDRYIIDHVNFVADLHKS